MIDDTLSDRNDQTMSRLAQITQAGYEVEVQWKCDFDRDILPNHPELKSHPIVQYSRLKT
jgi:G:T-mismatch repair DNA endonuclease (very short patch repair protein)